MPTKRAFNSAFNSAFNQIYSEFSIFQAKWLKIINSLSSLAIDCSVNVYRMVIGAADAATGVYPASYEADGVAQAILADRKITVHNTGAGAVSEEHAVFYLDVELHAGDRLLAADGSLWLIGSCVPYAVGDSVLCYRAEADRISEAEAEAISGWMCLVIGDAGIAEVSPSGLIYLASDESLSATAKAKEGYTFFNWMLDGVEIAMEEAVVVEPQISGVIHVLLACTWSSGYIYAYPETCISIAEALLHGSALSVSDQYSSVIEVLVQGLGLGLNDSTAWAETLAITNS